MTPEDHDEMMSLVLGLSHFIALVAADTLLEAREGRQMEAAGSSTYKVLMTLIESVLSEDPDLYAAIQMNLPKVKNFEKLFQRKTAIWLRLVTNRRKKTFARRMTKLQEKLAEVAPDFQKSYEKMYRIVEGQYRPQGQTSNKTRQSFFSCFPCNLFLRFPHYIVYGCDGECFGNEE
jgi:prephenate dehydrogenase